jgi:hypothetical protein
VEQHGTGAVLAAGGAVIGVLFGFFAQRSRFCLRAAVIEFWRGKFAEKLSVWLLAFAGGDRGAGADPGRLAGRERARASWPTAAACRGRWWADCCSAPA